MFGWGGERKQELGSGWMVESGLLVLGSGMRVSPWTVKIVTAL